MLKQIHSKGIRYTPRVSKIIPQGWSVLEIERPPIDEEFFTYSLDAKHGHELKGKWVVDPIPNMVCVEKYATWRLGGVTPVPRYYMPMINKIGMHIEDGVVYNVDLLYAAMGEDIRSRVNDVADMVKSKLSSPGDDGSHWGDLYIAARLLLQKPESAYANGMMTAPASKRNISNAEFAEWVVDSYQNYQLTLATLRRHGSDARSKLIKTDATTLHDSYVSACITLKQNIGA